MNKLQQKKRLFFSSLLTCILPLQVAFAAPVAEMTLDNGARVKLNDDFTWEYVILEAPQSQTTIAPRAAHQVTSNAIPTVTAPPKLNQQVMTQSELLKSTAKDGVKINIVNTQWNDDELGLTFELSSISNKHYVLVVLEAQFYNDDGTLIKSDHFNIWQATYRLPDTYLRKNETRESKVFWVEGIDKAHWNKQLMSLKITALESR